MAILIATFLVFSLSFIQNGAAGTCPDKCKSDQVCNDADSGCPDCQVPYWGRQCQHPYECKTTEKGAEYVGHKNTTQTGITCQRWSLTKPHSHNKTDLPENYCRNPDGEPGPWCYTINPDIRWKECGIESCSEHCSAPPLNVFGDVSNPPSAGFKVGVTVNIIAACGPGKIGKRTCQSDKSWSADFDCSPIKWCPKPTLKQNSYVSNVQDEYYFDTALLVSCETGYEMVGTDSTIRCKEDKSWGTTPSCTIVKCASPTLNDYSDIVNPESTYSYRDTITVGCKAGYTASGQTIFTCGADKSWGGNMPTCLPVPCQDLNHNQHSSIESGKTSGFVYGDKVKIICNTGYTTQGQDTLDCLANGQWNSQPPTCDPVPCQDLNLNQHSSVESGKTSGFVYGDKLKIICNTGYTLKGQGTLDCLANGKWNSQPPTCEQVKCTKPVLSENGMIVKGEKAEYVYKDSVVVSCSTGYSLQGVNTMTCHESGLWLGAGWRCIAAKCSRPLIAGYEMISEGEKNDYLYGDTVVVSCSAGYSLQGNNTMTCHESGLWLVAGWLCIAETDDCNSAYTIGGAVGGVVGVLFGAAIVLIICCIRRRNQSSAQSNNGGNIEKVENDAAGKEYINLGSDLPKAEKNAYDVITKRDSDHVYNELN